jgi:hypothetical protein
VVVLQQGQYDTNMPFINRVSRQFLAGLVSDTSARQLRVSLPVLSARIQTARLHPCGLIRALLLGFLH